MPDIINTQSAPTEPTGVGAQAPNQPTNSIPGAAPGETKAETMARMYKVNIDGQEMEVDENELRRGYSHSKAAEKKMMEAANARKEAEEVMKFIKSHPDKALAKLGIDPRKFADFITNRDLKEAMMTPQEKKFRQMDAQLRDYQQREQQAMAQQKQQEQEQEFNHLLNSYSQDMIAALESVGLQDNMEFAGRRIAHYMEAALAEGYENVMPSDVIHLVKEDYKKEYKHFLKTLPEDMYGEFIDNDIIMKASKRAVATGMPNGNVPKSVNAGIQRKQPQKKVMSPREYFGRGKR